MSKPHREALKDALEAAANQPITAESLAGAELVTEKRAAKVVYSARIDPQYSERIANEAIRCGQNPSQLIADLVLEALIAREAALGQNVMVNLADIQQAIAATAARRHAA